MPNAVFLDISMPQMDGTETLRLIHEIDTGIQVLVVSGYTSEDLARDLLKHGACDFSQKPVDLTRLARDDRALANPAGLVILWAFWDTYHNPLWSGPKKAVTCSFFTI